jgi:hypothetical protein
MFRHLSVAACAIAAISIAASSFAFAAGGLSRYSVQNSVLKVDSSRYVLVTRSSLGDKVTLNPQPLPPKVATFRAVR